jgi:2-polyprenyl-3-methyl-5-hydroxy-6-metoxy-1,4-benzoquinol methylase
MRPTLPRFPQRSRRDWFGVVTDYALRLSEEEIARYRLMAAMAQAREADVWELAGIRAGARVADVGCGPGALLPALSELVGAGGSIEAVDGDDEAVAAATALVASSGLSNVSVRQGRAEDTGLEAGAFDAVMMRHVLAHNGTAAQAIVRHLASLVRPGGCVFLVDVDMTAMRTRPDSALFDELRERYAEFQVARGGALQVGLHLDELLHGAGLEPVTYTGVGDVLALPRGVRGPVWAARQQMLADGIVSAEDLARWDAEFTALETAGTSLTIFSPRWLAVGRRP